MLKYLIIFLIFFCSAVKSQINDRFKHYEIDITAKRINFFSLISDVEIIGLEETESSFLSSARYYFKTPEGFGINNKGEVSLFDKEGNFSAVISNLGDGPNEYKKITSVWYRDGHIELFSNSSRSVGYYSLQGDHLKTIQAKYSKEWRGGTMIPVDGGYLMHLLPPSIRENAEYAIIKLDDTLKPVGKIGFNPYPPPFVLNLGKRFGRNGGHIYYKKFLSDSLFTIERGEIIPKMKFDLGRDWAWLADESTSTLRAASFTTFESEDLVEVLPDIGVRYIMLTCMAGFTTKIKHFVLVDRFDDSMKLIDLRKSNKENFEIYSIEWQDDQLIASLPVYDLEEFVSNLSESQYKIVGSNGLEDILSSENPVLLKIKFK